MMSICGEVTIFESGQTFRYQVSDPELGSGSSWLIKTHVNTGDVYIVFREGGKWMKFSAHDSGQSHYSLSAEALRRNPGDESPFSVKHDVAENGSGWRHIHRVTVARTELRHHQESVSKSLVVDILMPQGFDAVAIDVYLGAPGAGGTLEIHSPNRLIAVMNRGDGGSVLILARPCELPERVAVSLSGEIAKIRQEFAEQGWDYQPRHTVIQGWNEEGFHHEVEIVIEGP